MAIYRVETLLKRRMGRIFGSNQGVSQDITWWEIIERDIKQFATKYARDTVAEDNIIIAQLAEKVNEYESNPLLKNILL